MNIDGTVEEASAGYIIQDFEQALRNAKGLTKSIADQMNARSSVANAFSSPSKIKYHNMKQVIEKMWLLITLAKEVMEDLGITPIIEPIAVVQMGSKISFMGIPAPEYLCRWRKHAWSLNA